MIVHLLMVLLLVWPAQAPVPAAGLAQDEGLNLALAEARNSGMPHRALLAEEIGWCITDKKYTDPEQFRIGAHEVLRHSDVSKKPVLEELYLRLLQAPVIDSVFEARTITGGMVIDGNRRDWPVASIVEFNASSNDRRRTAGAGDSQLKAFGALRGEEALFVLFETNSSIDPGANQVFRIEIAKLAEQFRSTAYTITIAGSEARLFDAEGQAVAVADQAEDVRWQTAGRILEARIPLQRLEQNLRSVAVRGAVLQLGSKQGPRYSPWLACPTGPVTDPLEMLIHFAGKRALPRGNGLPVALALEEGLLLADSHADLAETIRADAFQTLEMLLDIDERLAAQGLKPVSTLPPSCQLAWTCRYDGTQGCETAEQYQFVVPAPSTIADLRGYAEVKGWLSSAGMEALSQNIAGLMSRDFKIFDYPNQAARAQGAEFVDSRGDAYYVKGDERYLAYRDVGVNERWKLFESGFGLKGGRRQALEFQRLLSTAVGLPSCWAAHLNAENDAAYTLSYDSRRQRWYPIGATPLRIEPKARIQLMWGKPWTRPERFEFWHDQPELLPEGPFRFLLDADVREFPVRRLDGLLNKGIGDDVIGRALLEPLRGR